jgi:copper chaperone
MEKTTLKVEGMSCEHCVKAVTNAVSALSGVFGVKVDLAGKTATVERDPALVTLSQIQEAIEDQGYDVVL